MNNYPTEEQLKFIKDFDMPDKPVYALLDFVEQIWEYGDWGFKREEHELELHTGGWSGNEEIIGALQNNFLFWSLYWRETHRGGHYYFDDKLLGKETKGFIKRLNP